MLFRTKRRPPPRGVQRRTVGSAPSRPEVQGVVYAIGDIHGRLDRFETLIGMIREDASNTQPLGVKPTVVLLGDLIDRGPASAGCIQRAIDLSGEGWCQLESLKGNHEQALLQFLDEPGVGPRWVEHGGATTLLSYGIDIERVDAARGWASIQAALAASLPASHLDYLNNMKLWLKLGDYLFVHAGVRPGLPLEHQTEADFLWIRQEFLRAERPHPNMVVVHGHTPRREPDLTRWRIGLDTGAYASGVLTAIRLQNVERTVIQAR